MIVLDAPVLLTGENLMATDFTVEETSAHTVALRNSTLPAHGPLISCLFWANELFTKIKNSAASNLMDRIAGFFTNNKVAIYYINLSNHYVNEGPGFTVSIFHFDDGGQHPESFSFQNSFVMHP